MVVVTPGVHTTLTGNAAVGAMLVPSETGSKVLETLSVAVCAPAAAPVKMSAAAMARTEVVRSNMGAFQWELSDRPACQSRMKRPVRFRGVAAWHRTALGSRRRGV